MQNKGLDKKSLSLSNIDLISCFPEDIFLEPISYEDHFKCGICLGILRDPILELKNHHTFGSHCFSIWTTQNEHKVKCPLCNLEIKNTEVIPNKFAKKILDNLKISCYFHDFGCLWTGKLEEINLHLKSCECYVLHKKENINGNVSKIIEILNAEINPHLKKDHLEIYNEHVQDWKWLGNQCKDWKWWWWAENPWWKAPCEECNVLWHKYEDFIEPLEIQRKRGLGIYFKIERNFA